MTIQKKDERNLSIDLLKIFCMILIILVHILQHYGVEESVRPFSGQSYAVKILLSFTAVAVNCYAITSGYLLVNKRTSLTRLVSLWFQIEFYSIGITALFLILKNGGVLSRPLDISLSQLFTSIFPINRNAWWYASSYVGLYLIIPILNPVLIKATRKQFYSFFTISFVVLCILPTVTYGGDGFNVKYGYSVIWLAIMYSVGAFFRLFGVKTRKWRFLIWFIWVGFVFFIGLLADSLFMFKLTGEAKTSNLLNLYISPFTVVSTIILFMAFLSLKTDSIKKHKIKKSIITISGLTFGVYLIHTHDLIWVYYDDCLSFLSTYKPIVLIILVITIAVIVFIVCGFIDYLRVLLFKTIRIDSLSKLITNMLEKALMLGEQIAEKIFGKEESN